MKVRVVARYKERGFAPFVTQQVAALEKRGVEYQFFPVKSVALVHNAGSDQTGFQVRQIDLRFPRQIKDVIV